MGADSQPALFRNEFASARMAYDERGNLTESLLFDIDGSLRPHSQGYAIKRQSYDARGYETVRAFFDPEGRPVSIDVGMAKILYAYDARGNQTELAFFGIDGKPAELRDGEVKVKISYDARGNKIEESLLGIDEKPVGKIATTRWSYDARNNMISVAYLGSDGSPTGGDLGAIKIVYAYDRFGREIEARYFDAENKSISVEVVIENIFAGTIAEQIGLSAGDVVFTYDGHRPTSVQQLINAVSNPSSHEMRTLVIRRGANFVQFEVPAGRLGIELKLMVSESSSEHESSSSPQLAPQ